MCYFPIIDSTENLIGDLTAVLVGVYVVTGDDLYDVVLTGGLSGLLAVDGGDDDVLLTLSGLRGTAVWKAERSYKSLSAVAAAGEDRDAGSLEASSE